MNTSTQNNISQLLLAQLPRTQFTHSTPPNPHAKKTSTQNFATPIGTATPNAIYTQHAAKPACQQDINTKFSQLLLAQLPQTQFTHSTPPNPHASNAKFSQLPLAQLPRTQFTHSTPPNPHARKTSTQNFRNSYWHSYPKRNLHTARPQTRMPGRHQRKIFAAPIGAATPNDLHTTRRQTHMPARHQRKIFTSPLSPATPNAIYTQHAAKPACQQNINAKFSQLLLAQLPRTQFTHSKPQKQQRPVRDLDTTRRQTRMPGRHQRKIFAPPIGAATPNAIYTQHAAKPECQEHISSTQNFRSSHWHSYPKRNLHTARRQTRMPGRHQRKIFAAPIGTATPNTIYTQHATKPACQEDINAKFSQLPLAQLPQTQFTHSTPPNPHASKTSTQNFHTSYWPRHPEHNLHTARRQTRMPGRHQRKMFAAPIGTATPNAIYTQHAAKPACQEDINAKLSQLLLAQLPQTQFKHSTPPNPNARKTSTQNFHSSYWPSYPERNLHPARRQTRMPGRHQRKIFTAPIGTATPNTIYKHSTPPNPHARKTSTQNFRTSYWPSYPERNLHTARRQTRTPGRHQRKIFAAPIGTATPNAIYTQQAPKEPAPGKHP